MSGLRQARKQQTRQALLDAALRLLADESLSRLGIREVTRAVGIAPAAFYRHFHDIPELGVTLVEQSFASLGAMFDELAVARADTDALVRQAVEDLAGYVHRYPAHFRFLARERHGGVAAVRRAIHTELRRFVDRLAGELAARPAMAGWDPADLRMLAELIVNHLVSVAAAILEAVDDDPAAEPAVVHTGAQQLRLIVLGRLHWSELPPLTQPPLTPRS